MSQPEEDAREAPSSLAPIQVERPSAVDEQDLARMRGSRLVRIAIAVVVLTGVLVGGAQFLRSMDAHQAYATAASDLERIQNEQGDAFLRCALPNQQHSQLTAPNALRGAIEIATERMGRTYGKVLTKCTPLLEGFQQAVGGIKAPTDVTPKMQAVSKAANDYGASWLSLRDALQRGELDQTQAAPVIDQIVANWEKYQDERTRAKQALSAKL